MKINQNDINYVNYVCEELPTLLNDIKYEIEQNDHWLYASERRARFDRIRIELNKVLLKIKKDIYGG